MSGSVNFPPAREISIVSTMPDKLKKFDKRTGQAIRSARNEKKWSQQKLAARVNIQRARLSNYERGERPIPAAILDKIAIALEVKPGYFYPEAEAGGADAVGVAATRQTKIDMIEQQLGSAEMKTLDMILSVLDLGGPR